MHTQLFLTATGDRYPGYAEIAAKRWCELLPELSGVTIAGDKEANALGFSTLPSADRACLLKLHAFDLIPRSCDSVLYADLDVYPIAPLSPSKALAEVDFACVRDRWDHEVVNNVCDNIGIPRHQYFNAGLFYARRSAAAALDGAKLFFNKLPWYDQTGLNLCRLSHRLKTMWLATRQNALDNHEGFSIACSHTPWHAWPAWETQKTPKILSLPTAKDVAAKLDFSHCYTTAVEHLLELAEIAKNCRHVLEVGTFQGHAAWMMATGGALITTLDPQNISGRQYAYNLSIDTFIARGDDWLEKDVDGVYDMVLYYIIIAMEQAIKLWKIFLNFLLRPSWFCCKLVIQ